MKQRYAVVDIDSVQPHPENPRKGDLDGIGASVAQVGFYGAVLVQESTGNIVVGSHRWKHLKRKKAKTIPVLFAEMSDEKALTICIADNRISDLGGYDPAAYAVFLNELPGDLLSALGITQGESIPDTTRRIEHHEDEANQAGSGAEGSYGDRLDAYKGSGVRSIVLDYTTAEFEQLAAVLPGLRAAYGCSSNSDLFLALLADDDAAA